MSENISSIGATGKHPFSEITECWNCETFIDRTVEEPDGPFYGCVCPKCKESLRTHPEYGEGKEKDLALEGWKCLP